MKFISATVVVAAILAVPPFIASFGHKSPGDAWRDSIKAEARSRGLEVREVIKDGYLRGYELIDRHGKGEPIRVSAYR